MAPARDTVDVIPKDVGGFAPLFDWTLFRCKRKGVFFCQELERL
jgi:hypothetical protein